MAILVTAITCDGYTPVGPYRSHNHREQLSTVIVMIAVLLILSGVTENRLVR